MALHRYHNDHVPFCLQPILKDEVQAAAVEMNVAVKEGTPLEYRHYVKDRDREK